MTTAVDSNILLDIGAPGSLYHEASRRALTDVAEAGLVIISEAVYAEISPIFAGEARCNDFLADLGVSLHVTSRQALRAAGTAWQEYSRRRKGLICPACGSQQRVACHRCGTLVTRRQHLLADFLIGAHALVHAGRLLTRDRGYYRTYFPQLVLV